MFVRVIIPRIGTSLRQSIRVYTTGSDPCKDHKANDGWSQPPSPDLVTPSPVQGTPFVPLSKIALIIGNDDYTTTNKLSSCAKDAQDVHNALVSIGFDSELLINTDGRGARAAIARLATKRTPYDICLFYFSGHGVEYSGRRYLLNVNPATKGSFDQSILMESMLSSMCLTAEHGKTIIISDACRVKSGRAPALKEEERQIWTDVPSAQSEFLLEFATNPNDVAYAGTANDNSVFTSYLIPLLARKDLELNAMFSLVRKNMRDAGVEQRSWTHHCLSQPVYLATETLKNE